MNSSSQPFLYTRSHYGKKLERKLLFEQSLKNKIHSVHLQSRIQSHFEHLKSLNGSHEREWLLDFGNGNGKWQIPFPFFGNGNPSGKFQSNFREREREREWKFHKIPFPFSGTGMRAKNSIPDFRDGNWRTVFPGTGMASQNWVNSLILNHIFVFTLPEIYA